MINFKNIAHGFCAEGSHLVELEEVCENSTWFGISSHFYEHENARFHLSELVSIDQKILSILLNFTSWLWEGIDCLFPISFSILNEFLASVIQWSSQNYNTLIMILEHANLFMPILLCFLLHVDLFIESMMIVVHADSNPFLSKCIRSFKISREANE